MPGAKSKEITTHIAEIQDLQEEIAKWSTRLAGAKPKDTDSLKDWMEELFMHISGLGHLEALKVAELQHIDTKSAAYKFQMAVNALGNNMGTAHVSWQRIILMKETLAEQETQVKNYAKAHQKSVDDFKTHWHVDHLPTEVQKKYDHVKVLAH